MVTDTDNLMESLGEEMRRWASQHGSETLRRGIDRGAAMLLPYVRERAAVEAPGWVVDLFSNAEWQFLNPPYPPNLRPVGEESYSLVFRGIGNGVAMVRLQTPPRDRALEPDATWPPPRWHGPRTAAMVTDFLGVWNLFKEA